MGGSRGLAGSGSAHPRPERLAVPSAQAVEGGAGVKRRTSPSMEASSQEPPLARPSRENGRGAANRPGWDPGLGVDGFRPLVRSGPMTLDGELRRYYSLGTPPIGQMADFPSQNIRFSASGIPRCRTPGGGRVLKTAGEILDLRPDVQVLVTDGGLLPDGTLRPLAWFTPSTSDGCFAPLLCWAGSRDPDQRLGRPGCSLSK